MCVSWNSYHSMETKCSEIILEIIVRPLFNIPFHCNSLQTMYCDGLNFCKKDPPLLDENVQQPFLILDNILFL